MERKKNKKPILSNRSFVAITNTPMHSEVTRIDLRRPVSSICIVLVSTLQLHGAEQAIVPQIYEFQGGCSAIDWDPPS